jgi:two-component system CheB/CheR fusion protein
MEREIIDISERERQNVGRELHDVLGQQLTGISFLVKKVVRRVSELSGAGMKELDEIADLVHEAVRQCGKLSKGMLLSNIDRDGLIRALDELASNTRKMFKMNCELLIQDDIVIKENFIATQLYRIIQEAVNNSLKHSRAENILILLRKENAEIIAQYVMMAQDCSPKRISGCRSGLEIMKYEQISLEVNFTSHSRGEGVSILVRIPLQANKTFM